jgi:SNF2 family DNA or RNA helicase
MVKFVEYKDAASVTLPPKHVHKVYFDLSNEEKQLHRFYTDTARSIFSKSQTSKGRNAFEALASMVRVLQVCSAPYLITKAAKEDFRGEDMVELDEAAIFPDKTMDTWIHERNGTAGLRSSKMMAFSQLVQKLRMKEQLPLKVVVFANMSSTLRLAQSTCEEETSVLVTGKMTTSKREELFTQFRMNPKVELLFMTLKLGSVGLNLTEADKVIFLEPWYSYASLEQGEGRVHRIGQLRDVNIYYLLAKDSAEERVYRVAENKKTLGENIRTGQVSGKTLQTNEMRFILMEIDN